MLWLGMTTNERMNCRRYNHFKRDEHGGVASPFQSVILSYSRFVPLNYQFLSIIFSFIWCLFTFLDRFYISFLKFFYYSDID
jgi:hypothetical protein